MSKSAEAQGRAADKPDSRELRGRMLMGQQLSADPPLCPAVHCLKAGPLRTRACTGEIPNYRRSEIGRCYESRTAGGWLVQPSLTEPRTRTRSSCRQRQQPRLLVTERPRYPRWEPPAMIQPHPRRVAGWGRARRTSFGSSKASIARGGKLTHPHGVQVR